MTVIDQQGEREYRHPWLGVEIRHLATLTTVARTCSFRQAAKELGYVQSAVSQQIARLEHVVGTRLVERQRGQRTVSLTRVGEVLAARGERILSELEGARMELSVSDEPRGGMIRLAVVADVAATTLPRLAGAVHADLPGTSLEVSEIGDDADMVDLLKSGDADVAIGVPPAARSVGSVVLLHDPFVLLATPGSRVAAMACVSSPADFAGERLIVPEVVLSRGPLHAPGLLLERALQVPLAAVVPTLVAQGHGLGLVPRSTVDHTAAGLATVPTAGLIAPQRVMLGWHTARRRTAQVEAFCDAAVRAFLNDELEGWPRAA
jgi:molybdate transport repressor ModE-like protein